ncbi:hypothetical protein [Cellvibrio sp. BR]|uniref:hypothetical protein n=1 Tax=Cellvibrio sp. BR TaxID=1134474 RepID=UPI00058D60C6|nr:hypothetical protein [Cellvibrio sp. BR]
MLKKIMLIFISAFPYFCVAGSDCSTDDDFNEISFADCIELEATKKIENYNKAIFENIKNRDSETCNADKYMAEMKAYQESFIETQLKRCKVKTFCQAEGINLSACGAGQALLVYQCEKNAAVELVEHLKVEDFGNEHCTSIPKLKD